MPTIAFQILGGEEGRRDRTHTSVTHTHAGTHRGTHTHKRHTGTLITSCQLAKRQSASSESHVHTRITFADNEEQSQKGKHQRPDNRHLCPVCQSSVSPHDASAQHCTK